MPLIMYEVLGCFLCVWGWLMDAVVSEVATVHLLASSCPIICMSCLFLQLQNPSVCYTLSLEEAYGFTTVSHVEISPFFYVTFTVKVTKIFISFSLPSLNVVLEIASDISHSRSSTTSPRDSSSSGNSSCRLGMFSSHSDQFLQLHLVRILNQNPLNGRKRPVPCCAVTATI